MEGRAASSGRAWTCYCGSDSFSQQCSTSPPPIPALPRAPSRTQLRLNLAHIPCSHQVDNTDPTARPGEFTDLTAVDKFELTDAEYAARRDTVQAHLKANKMGKYADEPVALAHAPPPPSSVPSGVVVGARCEVSGEGGLASRGSVRFVGRAEIGKGGVWVGVELDEPLGKGDGR